jgi:hypothetical protein
MEAFGALCVISIFIGLGLLYALRWPLVLLVVGLAIAQSI